jgi:predicted nucleic acid-binding protein
MKLISEAELKMDIKGKNILVDTNIIIYLTDNISPYASLSRVLFEMVESGSVFAYFSMVSIAEVLQGPLRKGMKQMALDVRDYLMNFPNSDCQEINRGVIDHIGHDKQIDWSKLRTLDSLIIASGLVNHVDVFVSNDEHFRQALPSSMLLSFHS